ncbi:MAG: M1 family peptidase, partial [Terrimonas sp.]|nr:M1 family peptidase [Terrimonas sp.]
MRNICSILLFSLLFVQSFGQNNYWQQKVDYYINVTLKDTDHTLDGFIKINYSNQSPDTLTYIWFHVWPNAYKNDKTA